MDFSELSSKDQMADVHQSTAGIPGYLVTTITVVVILFVTWLIIRVSFALKHDRKEEERKRKLINQILQEKKNP